MTICNVPAQDGKTSSISAMPKGKSAGATKGSRASFMAPAASTGYHQVTAGYTGTATGAGKNTLPMAGVKKAGG
jgi:hypothetical protein